MKSNLIGHERIDIQENICFPPLIAWDYQACSLALIVNKSTSFRNVAKKST